VNLCRRSRVGAAHRHIEAINDKHIANFTTVKSASKLDHLLALVQLPPHVFHFVSVDTKFGACFFRVEDLAALQSIFPGDAKHFLKAFFALVRDIELLGRELDRLRGNSAVVSVDQQLFVYGLGVQRSLACQP
jgi:hypothetical protein